MGLNHHLAKHLSLSLETSWKRINDSRQEGVYVFSPYDIDMIAEQIFSNLKYGGFATFVVSGTKSWDPKSRYFALLRDASLRGCKITRTFLLPHKQYLRDEILKEHCRLDTNAGITVKLLYIGDFLLETLAEINNTLDFGIWDDQIVCKSMLGKGITDPLVAEWKVSTKPSDIEEAINLKNLLMERSVELGINNDKVLDLEEPMVRTAPIMDFLSGVLCNGDYVSGEDCAWYHGAWQYLRILDLVSTPTWHPDFYIPQIKLLLEEFHPGEPINILVSGTADYSMLAHILWTLDSRKTDCQITVLDLCETPLIMCRWYASSLGFEIRTVKQDILALEEKNHYNLIVTDAFLTRFPSDSRQEVILKWFNLLKAGGKVITSVRINASKSDQLPVKADFSQINAFKDNALRNAARWQGFLPISPEQIAQKAEAYAQKMASFPVGPTEIQDDFRKAGFVFEAFSRVNVKGEMLPTEYAEIIAKKHMISI